MKYAKKQGNAVEKKSVLKNIIIFLVALGLALVLSIQFQVWNEEEHITTIFVFAVFFISLLTDGYVYGIIASIVGMFATNFIFTYPYFRFDFIDTLNLISTVIMVAISMITSLLATKIKRHEAIKAENDLERMRANLLRAVSHDLRTPLTAIYSASTMLKENKAVLNEQQQAQMLANIQEDAQWLIRMVENLLSVTRIDNNTMKIHKVPTILDELIDSVVSKFSAQYPDQNINVSIPDEIVVIPMDTMLVEQVLRNLLENAVFHAKGMTELLLRVYTLSNQVIFEIVDNGCGIDENKLKHLFTGCHEVQKDTSQGNRRYAGIGLSICATIINAHGGTITAENRKTGGALFRFTLEKEFDADDEQ